MGAPRRLLHLLASGDGGGGVDEATTVAQTAMREGRAHEALRVAAEALSGDRSRSTGHRLRRLLVSAALSLGTSDARALASSRVASTEGTSGLLAAVLEANALRSMGTPADALALLDGLETGDLEERLIVESERVACARRLSLADEERVTEALFAWGSESLEARVRGKVHTWLGLLEYRRGRWVEAARHHTIALELREVPTERLSSLLNAAASWLWTDNPERAEELAERGLGIADHLRHPSYVARAEYLIRGVRLRQGATVPDLELAEAMPDHLEIVHTEASIACRGRHPVGIALARRAHALWRVRGISDFEWLTAAMIGFLGGSPPPCRGEPPRFGPVHDDIELLSSGTRPEHQGLYQGVLR